MTIQNLKLQDRVVVKRGSTTEIGVITNIDMYSGTIVVATYCGANAIVRDRNIIKKL